MSNERNNSSYIGNFFKLVNAQQAVEDNKNKVFAKKYIENARTIIQEYTKQSNKKINKSQIEALEESLKEIENDVNSGKNISQNKPEARVTELLSFFLSLQQQYKNSGEKKMDSAKIRNLLKIYKEILELLVKNKSLNGNDLQSKIGFINSYLDQIKNISNSDLNKFIEEIQKYLQSILDKLITGTQEVESNKNKRISASIEEIKRLEGELKKKEEEKSTYNKSASNKNAKLEELKKQLEAEKTKTSQITNSILSNKKNEILKLQGEIKKIANEKSATNNELAILKAELEQKNLLTSEIENLKAKILQLESNIKKEKESSISNKNSVEEEKRKLQVFLNKIKTKLGKSSNLTNSNINNLFSLNNLNSNNESKIPEKLKVFKAKIKSNKNTLQSTINTLQEELKKKYQAEEREIQRKAEEAEAKRKAEEAEAKRQAEEAEVKRQAEEAEVKRQAEESEIQRKAEEREIQRKAEEREIQRKAEEREIQRKEEENSLIVPKIKSSVTLNKLPINKPNMNLISRYMNGINKKSYKKREMVGGDNNENVRINNFINIFLKRIDELLKSPSMIKLSLLKPDELHQLFINERSKVIIYKNQSTYTNEDVLKILTNFFYINITSWINDMFKNITKQNGTITTIPNTNNLSLLRQDYFTSLNDLENLLQDTKNYNEILKITSNNNDKKYYINIFKFLEFVKLTLKESTSDTFYKTTFKNIILHFIILIINLFDDINDFINNFESTLSIDFTTKIDKIYRERSNNTLLTYLRIRCDPINNNINTFNRRFGIHINTQTFQDMIIKYNDHNFPYYGLDKNKNIILSNIVKGLQKINLLNSQLKKLQSPQEKTVQNEIKKIEKEKKFLTEKYTNYIKYLKYFNLTGITLDSFKPNIYDYNYHIGTFNRIFTPNKGINIPLTNHDISSQLTEIMTKLKSNIPVFIMGYGASGSGKTSSLIYFNKAYEGQKEGILIHLCNQFAREKSEYKYISIRAFEYYADPNKLTNKYNNTNIEEKIVPKEPENNIIFKYENNNFILEKEYSHRNTFFDRTKTRETIFNTGTTMGQVLIHIIDTDRYVKATPNNPNSSRSHAIIIVKFMKTLNDTDQNLPQLVIGDFAGVENVFNCEDTDTLSGFSNAHINGISENPKFYSTFSKSIPNPNGTINKPTMGCLNYTQDLYYPVTTQIRRPANNPDHQFDIPLSTKIDILFDRKNNDFFAQRNSPNLSELENIEETLNIVFNNIPLYKSIETYIQTLVQKNSENIIYNEKPSKILQIFKDNVSIYKEQIERFINIIEILKTIVTVTDFTNYVVQSFIDKLESSKLGSTNYNKTQSINTILSHFISKQSSTINKETRRSIIKPPEGIKYVDKITYCINDITDKLIDLFSNEFIQIFFNTTGFNNLFIKYNKSTIKNITIDNLRKILQYIYISTMENYIELYCRISQSKDICEIRRTEGYMINGTLAETRTIIQNLILSRNKGQTRLVPPFMNECIPYYCNPYGCFETKGSTEVSNKIFNRLKEQLGEISYNNLVVAIFMLFNISPKANNPPPIPYIDIYQLNKLLMKIKNKEQVSKVDFKNILIEFINRVEETFKNKTKLITNSNEFKKIKTIYRSNTTSFLEYQNDLTSIISFINNFNSASAIGTLEFLDIISKYYTTSFICKLNETSNEKSNKYNLSKNIYKNKYTSVLRAYNSLQQSGGRKKVNKCSNFSKSKKVKK